MRKIGGIAFAAAMLASASPALAQNAPVKFLSAATTNSTLVKAGQTLLSSILAVNSTATIEYLKLYDKATPPVCGTDIPKWTIQVPALANGGVASHNIANGLVFSKGLGFCITGAITDNDTTPAVTLIAINFGLSGR